MRAATTTERATPTAPTAPNGAAESAPKDAKRGLRGLDFAAQEEKLRPGAAAPAPHPLSYEVSRGFVDGPYTGVTRYGVRFVGNECLLTVRCHLLPDADVPDWLLEDVQAKAQSEVARIWDGRFTLTDQRSHERFRLRVGIVFTADRPHLDVRLAYRGNREDEGHWYAENAYQDDTTFAHEIGHALGLADEYVDAEVPNRATPTSPGVHHDDSIMADANSDTAHAQLRHGATMASDIGAASHRQLSAALVQPRAGRR